eukprot:scaffold2289_cov31-Attheya_sp.AAC.2
MHPDSDQSSKVLDHLTGHGLNFPRHGSTVGITKYQSRSSCICCRCATLYGIVGVKFVSVKKVLQVHKDSATGTQQQN